MKQYAKAIAGAVTALIVWIVAQFGLELPDEVTGALITLITGGIIYWVKNHPSEP